MKCLTPTCKFAGIRSPTIYGQPQPQITLCDKCYHLYIDESEIGLLLTRLRAMVDREVTTWPVPKKEKS